VSARLSLVVRELRSTDGLTTCEVATPPVPRSLRAHVRSWIGYSEHGPPSQRRELPGPNVVVIIDIGSPIRVTESGDPTHWSRHPGGFVAGLDDAFSLTAHDGRQAGIQLNLTPLGARALLGVRLSAIARRVTPLSDLLLASQRSLSDRLASTPSWAERFSIMAAFLNDGISRGRTSAAVTWATKRIELAAGQVDIAGLAAALGYSRKHVASLFDEHVGLAPKLYASLVRFDRVIEQLKKGPRQSWVEVALAHGYADQAHLAREVKRFSGISPTTVRTMLAADLPGLFE
jgi:AraC-like DNA-binding protein